MSEVAVAEEVPPLFSPAFTRNPYPTYRKLVEGPAVQSFAGIPGVLGVFSYAHCVWLLRNAKLLSAPRVPALFRHHPDRRPDWQALSEHLSSWLLMKDAAEHTPMRKLMNPGFTPVAAERLRGKIETTVAELLDGIEEKSEADLLQQLAYPLPARVISRLLGVPQEYHERCMTLTDDIAILFGNPLRTPDMISRAQDSVRELVEIFRITIRERKGGQEDDLMGLLLTAAQGTPGMPPEVLHAQCVMMLFAGHETTRNLIGNALWLLLSHPEQLAEVRASDAAVRAAVEETLRIETPVQGFNRGVAEEMDYAGTTIPAGMTLAFMVAAAHRDPGQFQDPDRFDLHRPHNRHLAFGGDAHVCLGSTLARIEGSVAIREVVRRFPKLRLLDEQPAWGRNWGFRGLEHLKVALR
jgi:cytochrome P450